VLWRWSHHTMGAESDDCHCDSPSSSASQGNRENPVPLLRIANVSPGNGLGRSFG
jgi:hypothetical protein